jgi:hypothetical protein
MKLAQRFVSDDPPAGLIEAMQKTFLSSDGDIRAVLRTLFGSPEFWSPQSYRAKVKTPLEFVASAVRGTGAEVQDAMPLVQALNRMGMPLYGAQPPTGYSMKSENWVSSGAILNRINFAMALTSGRMPGVTIDPRQMLVDSRTVNKRIEGGWPAESGPNALLAELETALLAGDVSKQTHESIGKELSEAQGAGWAMNDVANARAAGIIAGLLLGSPEFQKR